MAGVGKRFTSGDPRRQVGRRKGQRNTWRKADLDKFREHVQDALNRYGGGVDGYLDELIKSKAQRAMFNALLRDLVPKPAARVEADATITVRWDDTPTPESVSEET